MAREAENNMAQVSLTVTVPPDVLFREVAGEAVLLNTATGKYYGLVEVGTRMWLLLAENHAVEPTVQALQQEYNVDQAQLRADLLSLIDKLASNQLVEIHEA